MKSMKAEFQKRNWDTLLIIIPFIFVFILLAIEGFFQKTSYYINIVIIAFIGITSIVLFIVSTLAYLKKRTNKFFDIMIAFGFFMLNGIVLLLGVILSINPFKIETISNLFFLGTLIWLLFPIIKRDGR